MSKKVMMCSFELAEGVSIPDFSAAAEKINNEFISKEKGYISWQQFVNWNKWIDLLTWESIEDLNNFEQASCNTPIAGEYFKFLKEDSIEMEVYDLTKVF